MSETEKTGADALVSTLADCGVTHCFANPGTSEMHLVQALDKEPRIHSTLCLFEGNVSGAADGFARMAQKPAMTLLHLGPGYGNAIANIHNARRAFSPMINVIGDHATYHRHLEAPLTSDIETMVKPNSLWVGVVQNSQEAGQKAAEAFKASCDEPGGPVSLLLPADSAWNLDGVNGLVPNVAKPSLVEAEKIEEIAELIKSAKKPIILVGGKALCDDEALSTMSRLSAAGVRIMMDTFPSRAARGHGRFEPDRMQYFGEMALADMAGTDLMVYAGTTQPNAFFAYPNKPSELVPEGANTAILTARFEDTKEALAQLAATLGAPEPPTQKEREIKPAPTGALNPFACAESLARLMPENSIISDDAVTAGLPHYLATLNAAKHDWLFLTGGAIGQGLPLAIGAQMAEPNRKVFALSGDGSAMYTIQALWTMGREKLPIVTIIFANRSYRILNIEMMRTEAGSVGKTAQDMLSIDNPTLDFVALAKGQGINAISVNTAEAFEEALKAAIEANEPWLIEAVV